MTIFLDGRMLSYKEIQQLWPELRRRAINQLLNRLEHIQACTTPEKLWGDEVEYMVVKFLSEKRQVKALLRAQEAREALTHGPDAANLIALWSPEMSRFQVETSPRAPYGSSFDALLDLYANMRARRREFRRALNDSDASPNSLLLTNGKMHKDEGDTGGGNNGNGDEEIISMSLFPLNGTPFYTFPECQTDMDPLKYPYASIMYPHQLVASERKVFLNSTLVLQDRKHAQVRYYVPIFHDKHTPKPFIEDLTPYQVEEKWKKQTEAKLKPNEILVDSAGFGLSACSMQLTQQATNLEQATYLYDQLAVLCPVMMAVTAASPIVRGFMSNWDNRWLNFCCSWEDRTPEERGEVMNGMTTLNKQQRMELYRIYSIETYLSEDSEPFNDVNVVFDAEIFAVLCEKGVSPIFARYIAHLMMHTPTAVTDYTLANETDNTFGLFTTIQDFTNWSTMRLKFPIINDENLNNVEAGFRVEFRTMDLQPTSFENVAFITFVRLVSLALLHYRLDLRIPISMLYDNILRSIEIDACRRAMFHWRRLTTLDEPTTTTTIMNGCTNGDHTERRGSICSPKREILPLTIQQIFTGSTPDGFIGLVPLVREYIGLHVATLRTETLAHIERCVQFVEDRATGTSPTRAQWVRAFVDKHPAYKHDSVVPQSVAYDLLRTWQAQANAADGISP